MDCLCRLHRHDGKCDNERGMSSVTKMQRRQPAESDKKNAASEVRTMTEQSAKREQKRNQKRNQVFLTGRIASGFQFSHILCGKYFYKTELVVKRNSGTSDYIPLVVSREVTGVSDISFGMEGEYVSVKGELWSYRRYVSGKNRLLLSVYVEMLDTLSQNDGSREKNGIILEGYICKPPVCRMTPMGKRITDIIVAVNRSYNRADYIPCICWGAYASAAAELGIGSHIQLQGRIQSREYIKRYHDGRCMMRTAYEVSASEIKCLDGNGGTGKV